VCYKLVTLDRFEKVHTGVLKPNVVTVFCIRRILTKHDRVSRVRGTLLSLHRWRTIYLRQMNWLMIYGMVKCQTINTK